MVALLSHPLTGHDGGIRWNSVHGECFRWALELGLMRREGAATEQCFKGTHSFRTCVHIVDATHDGTRSWRSLCGCPFQAGISAQTREVKASATHVRIHQGLTTRTPRLTPD